MREDAFDQPFAQAASLPWLRDDDIADVSERGVVRHRARKAHLFAPVINAKADRVFDGFLRGCARTVRGPVARAEQAMHEVHIQTRLVVADFVFATLPFHAVGLTESEPAREPRHAVKQRSHTTEDIL